MGVEDVRTQTLLDRNIVDQNALSLLGVYHIDGCAENYLRAASGQGVLQSPVRYATMRRTNLNSSPVFKKCVCLPLLKDCR
jgi:hypothetical protein